MKHVAILLAGGSGTRMGASVEDKILVQLYGKPVIAHALQAFRESACVDGIVIVVKDNSQRKRISSLLKLEKPGVPVLFASGGKQRQDSVRAGLEVIPTETEWILVHDCARPAVSPHSIKSVLKTAKNLNCAVSLAHRVSNTIRMFEGDPTGVAARGNLLDRDKLWAMETPQGFPRSLLERAHAQLEDAVTDDLAAVEALGESIALVESRHPNPKITRPSDLLIIESLLASRTMHDNAYLPIRTGLGYDIHQLRPGLPLILGGVRIKSDVGLVGHSDADVLSHAIADAILGGCGLPDIGHYFPNTDNTILGISSLRILEKACQEAAKQGYRLVNVDSTLIAEKPKISPHLRTMKSVLAKTLGLKPTDIGIKATTQEQIGALGKGEGIAAHAVATLQATRD